MKFWDRITQFLNKKEPQKQKEELPEEDLIEVSEEEFKQTPEFISFIKKSALKVTMLKPHLSKNEISPEKSKMGGIPNLKNFKSYPKCDNCESPLNFVLQIYKSEFKDFYFPANKNIFQIFRCPNDKCVTGDELLKFDHRTFVFYFDDKLNHEVEISIPKVSINEYYEQKVPDCKFEYEIQTDYPDHYDYEGNELEIIETKYGDEWSDYIFENYRAKTGTKYGGYPSWTQFPVWPKCKCGNIKEFFFQLSSQDAEESLSQEESRWSPHGLMMGDVGNMYFFVCQNCGDSSIETNWDCS